MPEISNPHQKVTIDDILYNDPRNAGSTGQMHHTLGSGFGTVKHKKNYESQQNTFDSDRDQMENRHLNSTKYDHHSHTPTG